MVMIQSWNKWHFVRCLRLCHFGASKYVYNWHSTVAQHSGNRRELGVKDLALIFMSLTIEVVKYFKRNIRLTTFLEVLQVK